MSAISFPAAWERYYEHLKVERGRRPLTIDTYRYALHDFTGWLAPRAWWQATPTLVWAYLDRGCRRRSRFGQPLSPATRSLYGTILRCFYDWAAREGLLDADPLRAFSPERRPAPIPRALDVADVTRLLEAVAGDPRTEVMVWMGYGLGLRAGEIAAARAEQLQLHGAHPFILVDGKGGKRRRVPLPEPVRQVLARFLAGRRSGPVIEHRQRPGRPILPREVSRAVGQAMQAAGIPQASHHSLRHTFVTVLLEQGRGQNLYTVSRLVGHSSTTITERTYSAYLGDVDGTIGLLPDPRAGNGKAPLPEVRTSGLAALVPVDVADQLRAAVQVLERAGPEVAKAVEMLQKATTAAWLACLGLQPGEDLARVQEAALDALDDERWEQVERAVGIDRGWDAAHALADAMHEAGVA